MTFVENFPRYFTSYKFPDPEFESERSFVQFGGAIVTYDVVLDR